VTSRGILLDIEGTTTPITFVYDVLFPFARQHAPVFLKNSDLQDLEREYQQDVLRNNNPPRWTTHGETYFYWLMDQDRKSTALKAIQGEIWLHGYKSGELHGEVFPDVPPALKRWHNTGADVRIFSSGSSLAQKLLFGTTKHGDLTKFLNGYFDTTTGPKNEPESYEKIAAAFGLVPGEILFVSDVTRELDAASAAGMETLLCVRPGNHPQPPHDHQVITTFEDINAKGN
jgi:enolase-phosphatase E1